MLGRTLRVRTCLAILLSALWGFGAAASDNPAAGAAAGAAAATATTPTELSSPPSPTIVEVPRRADFGPETPSAEARGVADWALQSADHQNLPFMVIDKVHARVYMFQPDGKLRGATSALLGLAIGDHTVPGIGKRPLSSIKPAERTTPAGRFMANLDKDIHGVEVLWVDYDSALSLHRVVPGTPKERRAQRLASAAAADKRITYGCINVPVRFYEEVVSPSFKGTYGVVYVLPETRPLREVFGSVAVQ